MANKLFPMSSISQKIEDFAIQKLHSVIDDFQGTDGSTVGLQRVLSSVFSLLLTFFFCFVFGNKSSFLLR